MNFSLTNLFYFAFRLGPFILVCFFILASFFQQDIKCIVYMVGLLVACFFAVLTGNSLSVFDFPHENKDTDSHCHVITLGESGPLSKIPLSTIVYAYTALYLANPIRGFDKGSSDLPLYFLFPLLLFVDSAWLVQYQCFNLYSVSVAILLGVAVGYAWSYIVSTSSNNQFFYFSILGGGQTCQKPSKTTFQCSSRKPDNLTWSQMVALYGCPNDSPICKEWEKEHGVTGRGGGRGTGVGTGMGDGKTKPDSPLKGVAADGTIWNLYAGDTIQCNFEGNFSNNRLEVVKNRYVLRLYPTDQIAASWDPNFYQKMKKIGDCNKFSVGDTVGFQYGADMEMNTDESAQDCTHSGIGCSAENMPDDGTQVACMNMANLERDDGNGPNPDTKNTADVMTYRVVNGYLHLLPTDLIRKSWENEPGVPGGPKPTKIQIDNCKSPPLPIGEFMDLNTNSNMVVNNPIWKDYPRLKPNDTVKCTSGGAGGSKMGKQIAEAQKSSSQNQQAKPTESIIYYNVMRNGSITAYPNSNPEVAMSYNANYLSNHTVVPDCGPYTVNFGNLGFNDEKEDRITEAIQQMINSCVSYAEIFALTGMSDLSGNVNTFKNKLQTMLYGKLKNDVWDDKDQEKVQTSMRDLNAALQNKGTSYASTLGKQIYNDYAKAMSSITWPDAPKKENPTLIGGPWGNALGVNPNNLTDIRQEQINNVTSNPYFFWYRDPNTLELVNPKSGLCLHSGGGGNQSRMNMIPCGNAQAWSIQPGNPNKPIQALGIWNRNSGVDLCIQQGCSTYQSEQYINVGNCWSPNSQPGDQEREAYKAIRVMSEAEVAAEEAKIRERMDRDNPWRKKR